jgi:hypothetical protein
MSRIEKRIILSAIVFVVVYLGAIGLTLHSRTPRVDDKTVRIESAAPPAEEEARLVMAELLLPMGVLFTLSVCFIIVRRKRERSYRQLEDIELPLTDRTDPLDI